MPTPPVGPPASADLQLTPSPLPSKPLLGWREWVALPQLGIVRIKAKIDTGARTSALHALDMQPLRKGGKRYLRFQVLSSQHGQDLLLSCRALLLDRRTVRSSSGNKQQRYVVKTRLRIGNHSWPIELTLTNRATMGFPLLLGRSAIRKRFLVDPAASFLQEWSPPVALNQGTDTSSAGENL
ncbi:ATP-dependent zinc protease [Candidatus Magnetaquicoccus inordinatus]|uniref:ATP-dependent zinc protease family protein n=1 Tax=Candidatus Magnetaquicoccus inordinatus TaxID=2496818 RepID=UPI00102BEA01|nr:RimK/LysX family protein [Candidatus Magnetaquicoccus inordinatus]